MASQIDFSRVRWAVVAGLLLVVAKTILELANYPALLSSSNGAMDGGTIVYLVLFGTAVAIYFWFVLFGVRPITPARRVALRYGVIWGLICGGLWIIELLVANVIGSQLGQFSTIIYFALVFAGYLVPGVAGLYAALHTSTSPVDAGLRAGLLSGMLGGLILFLAASAAPVLMAGARLDAQTLQEYKQSGLTDLDTFLASDFLAGMIAHLWIGIITGLALGLIGGLAGRALSHPAI